MEACQIKDSAQRLSSLKKLYSDTIDKAYEASYLITHWDINLFDIFGSEGYYLLQFFHQYLLPEVNKALGLWSSPDNRPALLLGNAMGIAVKQTNPDNGIPDYSLLTQVAGHLPVFIKQITIKIKHYAGQFVQQKDDSLNKVQLDGLKRATLYLWHDLENLQENAVFLPLKLMNYIHIIRHISVLFSSFLEQMEHFNDASQDLICKKLADLKYKWLLELFVFVDKVEIKCLLQFGTLSKPLMEALETWYGFLIHYAAKAVDFAVKGNEYRCIADAHFLTLRLEEVYQRIAAARKILFKIKGDEKVLQEFSALLANNKDCTLSKLNKNQRAQLIEHYKVLQPYLAELDGDSHELLVTAMQSDWYSSFYNWWFRHEGRASSFKAKVVDNLATLLAKKKATALFDIDLNTGLINGIYQSTPLTLYPYSGHKSVLTSDESQIVDVAVVNNGPNRYIRDVEQLTAEQALELHVWYHIQRDKFTGAQQAYDQLREAFFDPNKRALCQTLYHICRPYILEGLLTRYRLKEVLTFDAIIVNQLTEVTASTVNLFNLYDEMLQGVLTQNDLAWRARSQFYSNLAREKEEVVRRGTPWCYEPSLPRAHFVLKNKYSQYIAYFRAHLQQFIIPYFNSLLQKELTPVLSQQALGPGYLGIPFPALNDPAQCLQEAQQTLVFKRIFNAIYYLQQAFERLEQLNNRTSKTRFVNHLIAVYGYFDNIMTLVNQLKQDPYYTIVAGHLMSQLTLFWQQFNKHLQPYQEDRSEKYLIGELASEMAQPAAINETQSPILWYLLHSLYLLPEHLYGILNEQQVEYAHSYAKRAAERIEKIIARSDSYFKLLLCSPLMFDLYHELKYQVGLLLSTYNSQMHVVLDGFNQLFASWLSKIDAIEDTVGLHPGLLSESLRRIFAEYFQALIIPLNLSEIRHIVY